MTTWAGQDVSHTVMTDCFCSVEKRPKPGEKHNMNAGRGVKKHWYEASADVVDVFDACREFKKNHHCNPWHGDF